MPPAWGAAGCNTQSCAERQVRNEPPSPSCLLLLCTILLWHIGISCASATSEATALDSTMLVHLPPAGHQEAAETSVLEAQARGVPGALLERCRLLWARDKGHRAMLELQLALQQQLEAGEIQAPALLTAARLYAHGGRKQAVRMELFKTACGCGLVAAR